jgi:hypothetical protein
MSESQKLADKLVDKLTEENPEQIYLNADDIGVGIVEQELLDSFNKTGYRITALAVPSKGSEKWVLTRTGA